jgi:hypothetical protein
LERAKNKELLLAIEIDGDWIEKHKADIEETHP